MAFTISGIQQLGVGVEDVYQAWDWYRENFGADVLLSDAPGEAALMQPYTDHKPQTRHTILAYNMQGGGGLEIWQYTSRKPKKADFDVMLGDLGTFIGKIKSSTVAAAYLKFKTAGVKLKSKFSKNIAGKEHFFVEDPFGNLFEVVQSDIVFQETESKTGGMYGAIVGVSDMDKSIKFYSEILGYTKVVYDETAVFEDFAQLPGGNEKYRRVLLAHEKDARKGPFSNFLNESQIELIQLVDSKRKPRKIYDFKSHLWGDPGFIQICFDVKNMKDLKQFCESKGVNFQTDSNPEAYDSEAEIFDMGGASGHFTYIEDPDGNLIEFVETYYIPILEKFNIGLNLKNKNPEKPLPNFIMGGLKFLRKGGDYITSKKAKEKTKISDECAENMKKKYEAQDENSEQNN
ncbi:MAG: VOC family protein [Bacteroidales bacterium]|nr:VOC family protein [Bacteroidales bacterium]